VATVAPNNDSAKTELIKRFMTSSFFLMPKHLGEEIAPARLYAIWGRRSSPIQPGWLF
jgi:hypothetical protein